MFSFLRVAAARLMKTKLAPVPEGSSAYLGATVAKSMVDSKMRPQKMADLAMFLWCRRPEMTLLSVLLFTIGF